MSTFIIRVKESPGDKLSGFYIQGPRTPYQVKRNGYCFLSTRQDAWPFPSEAQARNKARIVERHMSHAPGWMEVLPL